MKRSFFQAAVRGRYCCMDAPLGTLSKWLEKWLDGNHHKNVASNIKQVLAVTPHKTPTIWPPASHHEDYPS